MMLMDINLMVPFLFALGILYLFRMRQAINRNRKETNEINDKIITTMIEIIIETKEK